MATNLRRSYAAALAPPPAEPDPDTLITSATAAALAGDVSHMTLWRWTRDKVIPAPIRIRGRKFWNRAAFLAALQAAGSVGEAA